MHYAGMGDYGEHSIYIVIIRATPIYIIVKGSVLPIYFNNYILY